MTLSELLEHIERSFAAAANDPVAFALLTGKPGGWRVGERRPVTGVRLGEDEVLVETSDPPPVGSHPGQLAAGTLLARLRALEAEYPDRPVEACEPEADLGGVRVRADYVVGASGRDEGIGTHLLFCLVEGDAAFDEQAEHRAAPDRGGSS